MESRASFVNVDDVGIFYWHFLKEALLFWCLFFGRHFGLSLGTPSSGRQHVSLCANDAFIIGIPWANLFSHSLLPKDHFSRKLRKKPGQHWERNSFAYHNEKNILLGGPLFFKHTNSATAMAVMPWPRYFLTNRLKTHGCNYKAKLVAKSWQNRSWRLFFFCQQKAGSGEALFLGRQYLSSNSIQVVCSSLKYL